MDQILQKHGQNNNEYKNHPPKTSTNDMGATIVALDFSFNFWSFCRYTPSGAHFAG